MTRYIREDWDKPHRCPECWCVVPYHYKPFRKAVYEKTDYDHLLPRRCNECKDVVIVPAWIARIARIKGLR